MSIRPAGGDTGEPLNLAKRLDRLARHLGDPTGNRMLDCGCGGGEYVRALGRRGARAWGIDCDLGKVFSARDEEQHRRRLVLGDLEHLPFGPESFDGVLLNEVLEHVPDDDRALREVGRVLRRQGRLALFAPNRRYPFESHGVYRVGSGRPVPPYVPFIPWIPSVVGRRWFRYWARNYSPRRLRGKVRRAGFRILELDWLWQTFENISGRQPRLLRNLAPLLRRLAAWGERTPLLRSFGISQLIVARPLRGGEPDPLV